MTDDFEIKFMTERLRITIERAEAAEDRVEALTEQLDAARHDADEAEAYAWQLEQRLAKAVEALDGVIKACGEGRMIPRPGHGVGGMTIDANIRGSIYMGVPAWPIEEARTTLAELKGGDRG